MPRIGILLAASLFVLSPAHADPITDAWRAATTQSAPTTTYAAPQTTVAHEWWYFAVQNATSACGPWQAMVTFISDKESAADMLLFTTVIEGVATNRTISYAPGAMRSISTENGWRILLEDNVATYAGGWLVDARSGGVTLDLGISDAPLWHRRAPEGGGEIDVSFAARAPALGSLTLEDGTVCEVTGDAYAEHVWGDWSRVPMWGVDFLNAHLSNGWGIVARATPMRGATNLYPALGADPNSYWPPSLVLYDGERRYAAGTVTFTGSDPTYPGLGIKLPRTFDVVATDLVAPDGGLAPARIELHVTDATLAEIPLATTSSGILEGWGNAIASIDGLVVHGTSEVELQRYGTRYPH